MTSDDERSVESSPPSEDTNVDAASDDGSDNVKPVNPMPEGDTTRMVRCLLTASIVHAVLSAYR